MTWHRDVDLNHEHLTSKASALPIELSRINLVCVGGLEPPTSAFQGPNADQLRYTQRTFIMRGLGGFVTPKATTHTMPKHQELPPRWRTRRR